MSFVLWCACCLVPPPCAGPIACGIGECLQTSNTRDLHACQLLTCYDIHARSLHSVADSSQLSVLCTSQTPRRTCTTTAAALSRTRRGRGTSTTSSPSWGGERTRLERSSGSGGTPVSRLNSDTLDMDASVQPASSSGGVRTRENDCKLTCGVVRWCLLSYAPALLARLDVCVVRGR